MNVGKHKKESVSEIVLEIEGMDGIKKNCNRRGLKEGEGEKTIVSLENDRIEKEIKLKKKETKLIKKAKEYQSSIRIEEEDNRND